MQMKNKLKEERASMAVYVTIVLLTFFLILTSIYFTSVSVRKSQLITLLKIKEAYEGLATIDALSNIQSSKVIAQDRYGVKVVVPKGFKVRTDIGTIASEGIVIEDANGNQFVWVPCTVTGEHGLTQYAQDKKYNDGTQGDYHFRYKEYTDWTDVGNVDSVRENGGFYVARFEAGIPNTASFYPDAQNSYKTTEKDVDTIAPVSKAGRPSWNWIGQAKAKTVSTKMYAGNNTVESRLIDSYAWDTIVNWMNNEVSGIAKNSTNYGNYYNRTSFSVTNALYAQHEYNNSNWTWIFATKYNKGNISSPGGSGTGRLELATGVTPNSKIKNIYDFAGNMFEWTTETGTRGVTTAGATKYAVHRGGSYNHDGGSAPVSYRGGETSDTVTCVNVGFRVVLYIK